MTSESSGRFEVGALPVSGIDGGSKPEFGDVDADDDMRDDEYEDEKAKVLLQSTKQYAPTLLPREALNVPQEIGHGRF